MKVASAQPSIIYQQCYGGSNDDYFNYAAQTIDGGVITTITSGSYDGDLEGVINPTGWVIKFNSSIELEWQKFYNSAEYECAPIKPLCLSDGNYTFGGYGLDGCRNYNGGLDLLLLHTSSSGDTIWTQCYGSETDEKFTDVIQTLDGGYLILGTSYGSGGDIPIHYGTTCCEDAIILKTDSLGQINWIKVLGGSQNDVPIANSVEISRGFYQIHIFSSSNDYDLSDCPVTDLRKRWILTIDSSGNIINENFLSAETDFFNFEHSIVKYKEYTLSAGSGNAASTSFPPEAGHAMEEGSIAFFDSTLNLVNMLSFGGSHDDRFSTMSIDSAGNLYFFGYSSSLDFDVPDNLNDGLANDYWIMSTDSNFQPLWSQNFGGNNFDGDYLSGPVGNLVIIDQVVYIFTSCISNALIPNQDINCSRLGDGLPENNFRDAWIVGLSIPTNIANLSPTPPHITLSPNPAKDQCIISVEDGSTIDFIQIFDALQRPVFRQPFVQNTSISLAGLNEGIYFVGLYSSTGLIWCEKLIIAQ